MRNPRLRVQIVKSFFSTIFLFEKQGSSHPSKCGRLTQLS